MSFTSADPNFDARVRASFAKQGAMGLIGAQLTHVSAGEVRLVFAPSPQLSQQHGFVHGGIVAAALDSACGYAASSLMAAEHGILTIEFKINFVAPAAGETLEMIGRVRKAGRTITLTDGEAFGITGSQRKLLATMTATMMTIQGRDDIKA